MRWAMALVVSMLCGGELVAQDLATLVAQSEKLAVRTGVAVRDLDGGELLYSNRAGEAFAPASNLKLLTAAAALHGLGGDYQFTTTFRLRSGKLVVLGGGDPNLSGAGDTGPAQVFARVAAALRQRGVDAIAAVQLDAGSFTGPDRPETWPQNQLDTYYCAPTGAFVLEQGVFLLRLQAGNQEDAAVSLLAPPVDMPLRGGIPLVDRQKGAVYGAIDLGDAIKLSGRFWRRSPPVEIRTAMRAPDRWFQRALEQALRRTGVRIEAGAAPADAEVYVHRSPLQPALQRALEDSSNFDAEQMLRVLGSTHGDGSFAGGTAAVRAAIRGLFGNLPPQAELLDGSGLSAGNRVTPALLVELLRATLRGKNARMFLACLPVGGESGTLEKRFMNREVGARVAAKTGWIRGASALSGVLHRKDGGIRVFSILMNYEPARSGLNKELKELQERMVEAMDALPAGSR